MWIWDKLTKATVIATNKKLAIKVSSQKSLLIIYTLGLFLVFCGVLFLYGSFVKSYLAIAFILALVVSHLFNLSLSLVNSNELIMTPKRIYVLVKEEGISTIHLRPPFCIDLFVKPKKNSIYIEIDNNGKRLGHFTLKNGKDLTSIIDGITRLLNIKLSDNYKLSNREVLTFRSKQQSPHSILDFGYYRDQWTIASKINHSNSIQFDFSKRIIKNYSKTIPLSKIDKIEIEQKKHRFDVFLQLQNKENVRMVKYSSTELNVIRDAKLLKTLLANRKELQGIEIELIEKR